MTKKKSAIPVPPAFRPDRSDLHLGCIADLDLAKMIMHACRQYALANGNETITIFTLKLQEAVRRWIEAEEEANPPEKDEKPGPEKKPECSCCEQVNPRTAAEVGGVSTGAYL